MFPRLRSAQNNVRQNKGFSWTLPIDLVLLAIGAYAIYVSTDWLVDWISKIHTGFISAKYMGWLSGWLMVLPNAIARRLLRAGRNGRKSFTPRRWATPTSAFPCASACSPCSKQSELPVISSAPSIVILLGATLVHFFFIAAFGRLPRFVGCALDRRLRIFSVRRGCLNNFTTDESSGSERTGRSTRQTEFARRSTARPR